MNILIIGSGGREHTLAWKLKQSPKCEELYIAPGNAGTATLGTNLAIAVTDFEALGNAVTRLNIELVIVGPEEPLVKGIADYFLSQPQLTSVKLIGPSQNAAQLEGSKSFAKTFMHKHGVPTAAYAEFSKDNYEEGVAYLKQHSLPIVIKADGLAAGKGVMICNSLLEALAEFELMILYSKFGEAGKKVVVEEFLRGIEVSVFALTDGKNYVILPEAKDYKRVGEGDRGLNTGGMGAVSPLPFFDESLREKIKEKIVEPTIKGLQTDNLDYKGFIFFGLMVNNGNAYVIEYNCRLGDPETEVIVPRIENDLVDLFVATADLQLENVSIQTDPRTAVAIMAVSGGYPGEYVKGYPISGLDASPFDGCFVFHAGTTQKEDEVVTNGGRVIVVTAYGDTIKEAAEISAYMLEQIGFEDMYFRKDIGYEFV